MGARGIGRALAARECGRPELLRTPTYELRRIRLPRTRVNRGDRGRAEGGLDRATPSIESALLLSP